MTKGKTGILLVNLGTPDYYTVPYVRKYLREFLMDARVIDIPFLQRWLLVNLIIAPFRAPKSSRVYKKLWTDQGSPLLFYGKELEKKLQQILGEHFIVKLGMRYQNPGIKEALDEISDQNVSSIIVFPLFPQYASATTGSIHQKIMELLKGWENIPRIKFINNYCSYNSFIQSFSHIARQALNGKEFDLMLFSYHGLPERQIFKASNEGNVVIIASSDMTHYEKQLSAEQKDKIALDCIIKLDIEGLYKVIDTNNISNCLMNIHRIIF